MYCYNCGKELKKGDKTKEHIPARSLFVGYGDEYKKNRITVPACYKCNNDYSKIDHAIRDAIGVVNNDVNDDNAKELSRKAVKSIISNKNWKNRVSFNFKGQVESVKFDYNTFKRIVIKDFKGIFYKEFGFPLPDSWRLEIIAEFETNEKLTKAAIDISSYLDKDIDWSESGHANIFKYKFKTMAVGKNELIYDSDDLDIANNMASIQIYHDKFAFIVMATRKSFLNAKFRIKEYLNRKKRK
ncbi:MAG: hypothetical protein ACK4TA_01545 [Saprospiraceae bacterium]